MRMFAPTPNHHFFDNVYRVSIDESTPPGPAYLLSRPATSDGASAAGLVHRRTRASVKPSHLCNQSDIAVGFTPVVNRQPFSGSSPGVNVSGAFGEPYRRRAAGSRDPSTQIGQPDNREFSNAMLRSGLCRCFK